MATAQRVLLSIFDELITLWKFTNAEVRHVAFLYGRILDVSLVDILTYLVEHNQAGAVQNAIGKSVAAAGITHRKVLQTIVGERLHQLGADLASDPESKADFVAKHTVEANATDSQRPSVAGDEGRLLTVKEAMTLLNVSRQTIHRLVADGKLVQVKIGRAVRFSQHDLERFIGR